MRGPGKIAVAFVLAAMACDPILPQQVDVRIVADGKPVANALVVFFEDGGPVHADADGKVSFRTQSIHGRSRADALVFHSGDPVRLMIEERDLTVREGNDGCIARPATRSVSGGVDLASHLDISLHLRCGSDACDFPLPSPMVPKQVSCSAKAIQIAPDGSEALLETTWIEDRDAAPSTSFHVPLPKSRRADWKLFDVLACIDVATGRRSFLLGEP